MEKESACGTTNKPRRAWQPFSPTANHPNDVVAGLLTPVNSPLPYLVSPFMRLPYKSRFFWNVTDPLTRPRVPACGPRTQSLNLEVILRSNSTSTPKQLLSPFAHSLVLPFLQIQTKVALIGQKWIPLTVGNLKRFFSFDGNPESSYKKDVNLNSEEKNPG
ncbi:unnamed protein product [Dovyalis caffra]|uniref:Uncharacterized protein n=1 Tax=Dovyalis caffra TaxID=77055 RepID=A0AAV1S7I8_9ROSI|nr:unnamed protein product [Dovyalis caffra]